MFLSFQRQQSWKNSDMGLTLTSLCVEKHNADNEDKIIDDKEKVAQIPILNDKELEMLDSLLEEKKNYKAITNEFSIFSLCVALLFLYGMSIGIREHSANSNFFILLCLVAIVNIVLVLGYIIKKTFDLSPLSKLYDLGLGKRLTSFVTFQLKKLKERMRPAVQDEKKLYIIQEIQHI